MAEDGRPASFSHYFRLLKIFLPRPMSYSTDEKILIRDLLTKVSGMHPPFPFSDWGTLLIAAPCASLLVAVFFRLDVLVSPPKRRPRTGQISPTGIDENGHLFFTDPDGRRWYPSPRGSAQWPFG
jgi:hypothetical protein